MRITGYRTLTEKEHNSFRLLRKHRIPAMHIDGFLKVLKGELPPINPDSIMEFCVVCNSSSNYHLRLDQLPKNTTELLIAI